MVEEDMTKTFGPKAISGFGLSNTIEPHWGSLATFEFYISYKSFFYLSFSHCLLAAVY